MPLGALPHDLLLVICSYLGDNDVCNFRLVNRFFKEIFESQPFWMQRFFKTFGILDASVSDWKRFYTQTAERSWDPIYKCDQVVLTNLNRKATHSDDEGWESVQIRKGISSGKHYYEVKTTGRLTFGIASKDFSFNSEKNMGGENVISYGYASNGNYARPNERWKVQVAQKFRKKGDVIGMLVDLDGQCISFWKGGKKQKAKLEIEKRYRVQRWYITATMFDDSKTTIELTPSTIPPKNQKDEVKYNDSSEE